MTRAVEIEELIHWISHNSIPIEQNVQQLVSLAGRVGVLRTPPGTPLVEDVHNTIKVLLQELEKAGKAIDDHAHGHAAEHLGNVLTGVGLLAYGYNLNVSREFLDTLFDGLYSQRPQVAAND